MKFLLDLLLFIAVFHCIFGQLTNSMDYLNKVGKHFAGQLEQQEVTGKGMPLQDFVVELNASRYDIQAFGNVTFRNGFVTLIERSYYDDRKFREIMSDSGPRIEGILTFGPMELYYDVDLNLTYYQGSCSMLINFARVEFEFMTGKAWNGTVTSSIRHLSASRNVMTIDEYPSNSFTQTLAYTLKTKPNGVDNIIKSMGLWNDSWEVMFQASAAAYSFPEVCYYC